MPQQRSARSVMSDGEMEGMAEAELTKLHRQFRIMENDRAAYTEESQNMIRKQKKEMTLLEHEKKDLLIDLRLAESRSNQIRDELHTDTLVTLLEAKDEYEKDIEQTKMEQAELDAKMKEWQCKIEQLHKDMSGVHTSYKHTTNTDKTVRVRENRLDQSKKRFNDCLCGNGQLREEIDSLRNEHKRFECLYKKLEKEVRDQRGDMGEVIERSTAAYDARDEAQMKMVILKEKSDKDMQQHNTEMKELVRIIDHDRKLKVFMGIKGQERQEDPQLVVWRHGRELAEAERRKESQEDSVDTYERAFQKIREMTGTKDLNTLVFHFIDVEDTNFALFNYVNEQNNEIVRLTHETEDINNNIIEFKSQGMELDVERQGILRLLEERQNEAQAKANEYEQKCKEVAKILDQLQAGIDSLFRKISCDRSAIDSMLGAASGVTESNVVQYLGIVEQRTNELLAILAFTASKDLDTFDGRTSGLLGDGPDGPQQLIPIRPPAIGDEYESDGSDAGDGDLPRPYTRAELEAKVMNTVRKRESVARRDGFKYDLSIAREKVQKQKDSRK